MGERGSKFSEILKSVPILGDKLKKREENAELDRIMIEYEEQEKHKKAIGEMAKKLAVKEAERTGKPWECFTFGDGYPKPGAIVKIDSSCNPTQIQFTDKMAKYCAGSIGKIGIVERPVHSQSSIGYDFMNSTKWVWVSVIEKGNPVESMSDVKFENAMTEGAGWADGVFEVNDLSDFQEPTIATFNRVQERQIYGDIDLKPAPRFFEQATKILRDKDSESPEIE